MGREPDWERLIREQQTSGMRMEDFCRARGINKHTFKNRKYGRKSRAIAETKFIEVSRHPTPLSVKLRNGHTLEISPGFNESELLKLIRVLETC